MIRYGMILVPTLMTIAGCGSEHGLQSAITLTDSGDDLVNIGALSYVPLAGEPNIGN